MSKKALHFAAALMGLASIAGCRSPLKQNIVLKPINPTEILDDTIDTIDDIRVQAYKLSKKECAQLLGVAIKNTDVIQITVTNNTPVEYTLHQRDIEIDLLSRHAITQRIQNRNYAIKKELKGAAFTGSCCTGVAVGGMSIITSALLSSCVPLLVGSGIIAAGIGVGIKTSRAIAKKQSKASSDTYNILKKISPKTLSIAPSKTASLLIFVDDWASPDSFTLTLCPVGNNTAKHTMVAQITG